MTAVSPVPGEPDPARLADAERKLRRIARDPAVCNATVGFVDALRLRTLLAEYDRRAAEIADLRSRLARAEQGRDRLADLAYNALLGREPDTLDLGDPDA